MSQVPGPHAPAAPAARAARPMRPPRARRRGIALMEALIAVLLMSVCALAYAALQMRGLSANASSMWRSKASLLAYDMADRMRSNRSGVAAGSYNSLTGAATAPSCGTSSACTTAQMAQLDFALWTTALANRLPGGSGAVCVDSSPDDGTASAPGCDGSGGMFVVKVFWSERGVASRLALAVRP